MDGFEIKYMGAKLKPVWYVFAFVLAAIGALSLFRFAERLPFGGGQGSIWIELFIGVICFLAAWRLLKKARAE